MVPYAINQLVCITRVLLNPSYLFDLLNFVILNFCSLSVGVKYLDLVQIINEIILIDNIIVLFGDHGLMDKGSSSIGFALVNIGGD